MDLWGKDYQGAPFQLFGTAHLISLAVVILVNLSLLLVRRSSSTSLRNFIRYGLVVVLVVGELIWHTWNIVNGFWSVQSLLPLQLCSVFVWLSAYMLLTKSYRIYEYAYFIGIGGAAQAIITPDAGIYGFPHYRYVETIVAHGAIVMASMYMTLIEGYRPYWSSLLRTITTLVLYTLVIHGVNLVLGSNYLFTVHKPESASIMDYLGPWPWYMLPVSGIAIGVFVLLYLPFAISDWRKARAARIKT